MLKPAHDIDIAKSHNQSRAHLMTSHISLPFGSFLSKGETRLDRLNPPTLGKLSEVSLAAFPRWGRGPDGGRVPLDGSGPAPFPGSFFLPLAFPDTIFAALFFQVTFFSPLFHLFFTFVLPLFNLFLAFPKEKLTFQGPEGAGARGKKKVSGKGKTRWHADDASARSGRGRAAAGPAMREGGGGGSRPFWVGLGVGRGWWRGGRCPGPRATHPPNCF